MENYFILGTVLSIVIVCLVWFKVGFNNGVIQTLKKLSDNNEISQSVYENYKKKSNSLKV